MAVRKMSRKSIIVVVAFAVVLVLAMRWLGNLCAGPELGELSLKTGPESTEMNISLDKSVYGTSTNDMMELRISNLSDGRITHGRAYLEKLENGQWYQLQFRPYETQANELLLDPKETKVLQVGLEHYGPRLCSGHYRLVVGVFLPNPGYVSAEFDAE